MKIVVAVDGSQYGRWAVQWVGRLPFAKAPAVKAVHAVDVAALRAPFVVQPAVVGYDVLTGGNEAVAGPCEAGPRGHRGVTRFLQAKGHGDGRERTGRQDDPPPSWWTRASCRARQ